MGTLIGQQSRLGGGGIGHVRAPRHPERPRDKLPGHLQSPVLREAPPAEDPPRIVLVVGILQKPKGELIPLRHQRLHQRRLLLLHKHHDRGVHHPRSDNQSDKGQSPRLRRR